MSEFNDWYNPAVYDYSRWAGNQQGAVFNNGVGGASGYVPNQIPVTPPPAPTVTAPLTTQPVPVSAPVATTAAPTTTPTTWAHWAAASSGLVPGGQTSFVPDATAQVVPGMANPNVPNHINVVDFGGQLTTNPHLGLTYDNPATAGVNESMLLADHVPSIDPNAPGTSLNPAVKDPIREAQISQAAPAATATATRPVSTSYDAFTDYDLDQMEAAYGTLSDGAILDDTSTPQIGPDAFNRDAYGDAAYLDISTIVDTNTTQGKALADQLGKFNYVDKKATLRGQLEYLQDEFTDSQGNPKIPIWAQEMSRNVAKTVTFGGMTGSAATAAMANAMMEASIPVAQAEAQFFQTVSLQNLNNEQQSIINKANILSKFELANLDVRTASAIQNAKSFLEMDMANLSNEQQARIINNQARNQAAFESVNQENIARQFGANAENEANALWAQLSTQTSQFNANQVNSMEQFNTSEANSVAQFNANLAAQQDQFYRNMNYQVELANAQWRQRVTLQEAEYKFAAAAQDVQNLLDISQTQLAEIWDRSNSLLDYAWKTGENEADRNVQVALGKLQADTSLSVAQLQRDAESSRGWGTLFGSIAGGIFDGFDFGDILGGIF